MMAVEEMSEHVKAFLGMSENKQQRNPKFD
jgi:hypothetical protein